MSTFVDDNANISYSVTCYNMQSVTSNAVAECLKYSETEHIVGTWIDGKPLYERTAILDVPRNGSYNIYTQSGIKVRDWRGNFFQRTVDNPEWIMHIPYSLVQGSEYYIIYVYYDPNVRAFSCSFICHTSYYVGKAVITYRYTKNTD